MTKTFTISNSRKDTALVCFSAGDAAGLLKAISCNTITGYVRQLRNGGPVSVPKRHVAAIEQHLINFGWARA